MELTPGASSLTGLWSGLERGWIAQGRKLRRTLFHWWLAAFLLLGLVFVSGVLNPQAIPSLVGDYPTRPINSRPHFDRSSEILVENMIDARLAGSAATPGGFMFRIPGDPRVLDANVPASFDGDWRPSAKDLEGREIYSSQFGFQARVYAAAAAALDADRTRALAALRGLTAICLAATLSVILLLIRREWGGKAAAWGLAFCALSTGFNLFAPSLYWITFMHVAPAALISAALLLGVRSRIGWSSLYLALFVLFLLKFLSGFEFLTVTVAGAAIPFFLVQGRGDIVSPVLLRRIASILAIGIAAFVAAIAIHHVAYQSTFGQSGLAHLLSRSETWTSAGGIGLDEQVRQFAKILVVNMIDYAGYGVPSLVGFAAGVLFLLFTARLLLRRDFHDPRLPVYATITAAFLASISWLVLQSEHVAFHPRYATILLAYPFGIFVAAGTARLLSHHAAAPSPSPQNSPQASG